MSRYLAHQRPDVPPVGVAAAFSFLVLAGVIFVYSLMLRSNAAVFEWGRQMSAQLGWTAVSVSQPIPANRVVVLLEPADQPVRLLPKPPVIAAVPPAVQAKPVPETPALVEAPAVVPVAPIASAAPRPPARQLAAVPAVPEIAPVTPRHILSLKTSPVQTPAPKTVEAMEAPAKPVVAAVKPLAKPDEPKQRVLAHVAPIESLREPVREDELASLIPGPMGGIETAEPIPAPTATLAPSLIPPKTVRPESKKAEPEISEIVRLKRRAKDGIAAAQLALAQRYHVGDGVDASALKALYWYHRAAGLGSTDAQFNLGLMYYLGDGVPKDLVSAYRWISLAASQKDRRAKVVLDGLHRSLPAPIFTALVFPEPVVLGPAPVNAAPARPITAVSMAAPIRPDMSHAAFWKPSVFLLGNKPLP